MIDIVKTLNEFTEQNNLWSRTRESGINCLRNHFKDISQENLQADFVKKSQILLFWSYFDNTLIVRTTYNLKFEQIYLNNLKNTYSTDVDQNGKIVDDCFVLEK